MNQRPIQKLQKDNSTDDIDFYSKEYAASDF